MIRGIVAGLIAYAISGKLGLYLLQLCWSAYETHSADRSYTLSMLLARLFVGTLAAIAAGVAATKFARDKGRTALLVGLLAFSGGAYVHFLTDTWTAYPIWYHLAYVLPIIPVTGLGGYLAHSKLS
ncbi:MAG: hypothetical protein U0V64_14935 [Cyclobacteriaceae bacterium]